MMQQLKRGLSSLRVVKQIFDYRADKWLADNVIPFWTEARLRFRQKVAYNRSYTRAFTLIKLFTAGYLLVNLLSLPFDEIPQYGSNQLILTEYEVLSNHVQRDQYEEWGSQPNLKRLFKKGKSKGLTQVQLFELSKYMERNYLTKEILHHLEYLQNLKAQPDN